KERKAHPFEIIQHRCWSGEINSLTLRARRVRGARAGELQVREPKVRVVQEVDEVCKRRVVEVVDRTANDRVSSGCNCQGHLVSVSFQDEAPSAPLDPTAYGAASPPNEPGREGAARHGLMNTARSAPNTETAAAIHQTVTKADSVAIPVRGIVQLARIATP